MASFSSKVRELNNGRQRTFNLLVSVAPSSCLGEEEAPVISSKKFRVEKNQSFSQFLKDDQPSLQFFEDQFFEDRLKKFRKRS